MIRTLPTAAAPAAAALAIAMMSEISSGSECRVSLR